MQHLKDDRALFNRRGRFAAIALGIVTLMVCALSLGAILWRHHHERYVCESYSPGYEPKGCAPQDMAAWKALGVRPAPGASAARP